MSSECVFSPACVIPFSSPIRPRCLFRFSPPPHTNPPSFAHSTFNIIHGPKYDVWTLKADSPKDRDIFMKGLNALLTKEEVLARITNQRTLYAASPSIHTRGS